MATIVTLDNRYTLVVTLRWRTPSRLLRTPKPACCPPCSCMPGTPASWCGQCPCQLTGPLPASLWWKPCKTPATPPLPPSTSPSSSLHWPQGLGQFSGSGLKLGAGLRVVCGGQGGGRWWPAGLLWPRSFPRPMRSFMWGRSSGSASCTRPRSASCCCVPKSGLRVGWPGVWPPPSLTATCTPHSPHLSLWEKRQHQPEARLRPQLVCVEPGSPQDRQQCEWLRPWLRRCWAQHALCALASTLAAHGRGTGTG